jgi:hypothetical protein
MQLVSVNSEDSSHIHWKKSELNLNRSEDLVFIHANLRLLSRKRNDNTYNKGAIKMRDIDKDE